jgi:2-C-methyl-D-erythritol 4-phosphate cytidylyltransferase
MGAAVPKQFLPLAGEPVLVHTLRRFAEALPGARIVVALPESDIEKWNGIAAEYALAGSHTVCAGGATRFDSVKNALGEIGSCNVVAVHDGVRPLVSGAVIKRCVDAALEHGAAVPVVPLDDSLRSVAPDGSSQPVDRSPLRAVQTPQVFRRDLLVGAYETPYNERFTDDATVVENAGVKIVLCEGDPTNIKITKPSDLALAEALLKMQNG